MKITPVAAIIPEAFGLAIVGAAVGAFVFGAGNVGVTPSVLAGSAAGAAVATLIILVLRIRSVQKRSPQGGERP